MATRQPQNSRFARLHKLVTPSTARGKTSGYWWVTNYAAPYRRPVWEYIAEQATLTVALLENEAASSLHSQNRGSEWRMGEPSSVGYRLVEWPTRRLVRGETVLYVSTGAVGNAEPPEAILIGGWESPAYWQILLKAKLRGWRTVGFYESTLRTNRFTKGPVAWARGLFFRSLDAVVVPGVAARHAVERMGVHPARVFEGFNAVDVETIHERTKSLRHENNRHHDADMASGHRYLFIGQLIGRKNADGLLRAFGLMSGLRDSLTIAGGGPELESLRALALALGLEARVRFVGPIAYEEVPALLAAHDTLVLPSHEEVWGLVANEALAGGLHCVVTDVSGVADSVRGMDGVYVTDTSSKSLASGMRLSKQEWTGPIECPKILQFTPERLAKVFLDALGPRSEKSS